MTASGHDTESAMRCPWAAADPLLAAYHDAERGRFPSTEAGLFEALSLDVLQRGRSWREVLLRREDFRRAFMGFDPERVAAIDEAGVARISHDLGLHGHDGRVRAVAQNARRLLAARAEWGSGRHDVVAFARWLESTPPAEIVTELADRFRCVTAGSARHFVEAIGRVPLGHAPDCWRARAVILDLDGVLPDDRNVLPDPEDTNSLDGVGDAIRVLAARHPLAAASSRPYPGVVALLQAVGIRAAFEVVASTDEPAAGGAPAGAFLLAASRLALRPADCVVVTTSRSGVAAAETAGIAAVLVPDSNADGAAPSFERVPGIVRDAMTERLADTASHARGD